MDRRVAQGRPPAGLGDRLPTLDAAHAGRRAELGGALAFGLLALFAYTVGDPGTERHYNHFVWQALAFLDGRAEIDYPVLPTVEHAGNAFFQDVMPVSGPHGEPTGRGLIPFPPLPALVLVPFVALWGATTDDQAIAGLVGAIDVVLAWWMLGRLPIALGARVVGTLFLGFGTVFFYAAELGTTWYFAHVVAVGMALLAIGIALGGDPRAVERKARPGREPEPPPGRLLDPRGVAAGLLLGLAATARLTVAFAAPFLLFVGPGRSWLGRGLSAGIGAAIPIAVLVAYNVWSTGDPFHPAYEHLYRLEARYYPTLGYNLEWGIQDLRYVPQNLEIALLSTPVLFPTETPAALGDGLPLCPAPEAGRGLFDRDCPLVLPRDTGMSILLTSPAYLLAIPVLIGGLGRSRLVTGAALAVAAVFVVNLMHFSQGWVQFGYRFSNDLAPFALPLVALGAQRLCRWPVLVAGLLAASIAINLWGAVWGAMLGW